MKIRKTIEYLFIFLLLVVPAFCQFTSVTATVVDSDNQAWKNGYWSATLYNPNRQFIPNIGGVPLTAAQLNPSGSLDSSGNLSTSLADNGLIAPAGTYWQFIICPLASTQCSTVNTPVTGISENISSIINAGIKAPRFPASPTAFGYLDGEISPTPNPGGFYFNITNLVTRIWNGTAWQNGGGAAFPVATAPGQILTSTAAGVIYATQGQVFYSQPGDTISTIEGECTNPCTYFVTSPQTFTLSGNHTLNSNIYPFFIGNGSWTINGVGFTLTISGDTSGNLQQHFFPGTGNIKFGTKQQYVPVEWFGAKGDGITVDTTAIQNTLNSITNGQAIFQGKNYIACGLSITTGSVGIKGTIAGTPFGTVSTITCNSATSTVLSVTGTNVNTLFGNVIESIELNRSVTPTTNAKGLNISYAATYVKQVTINDSVYNIYLLGATGASFIDCYSAWGFQGTTVTGPVYALNVDSTSGVASDSVHLRNFGVNENSISGNTYGIWLHGSAINDFFSDGTETSNISYPIYISYTGTSNQIDHAADIHFTNSILDGSLLSSIYIENIPPGADEPAVEISGGWMSVNNTSIHPNIDIEDASGISIVHMNISTFTGQQSIYINNSIGDIISDNNLMQVLGKGIVLNNTNATIVANNSITGVDQGINDYGIYLGGTSSNNVISSNQITGTLSTASFYGIYLETGATNNSGLPTNVFSGSGSPTTAPFTYIGSSAANNTNQITTELINGGAVSPWAFTHFSNGFLFFNNGSTDSPLIAGYTAANTNVGFNFSTAYSLNGCSGAAIRYGSNLGEVGGAVTGAMDSSGDFCSIGNITAGNGTNTLYRCTTAGTLPVGALTTVTGNCGAFTDTGIRVK